MSQSAKWNQMLKIYGIVKLKCDVIFISDVRMSNKNLISTKNDIEKLLRCNPYEKYDMIANSTKNKRGVAILTKSCLDITIVQQLNSPSENILAVRAILRGEEILLIAIYGPNNNNPEFFNEIDNLIGQFPEAKCIIGGDWNCTVSTDNVIINPDCLNMRAVPNTSHSRRLLQLCQERQLADPYRHLYPDRKEFTYCPRDALRTNKS
jgi:exonuclease III